MQALSTLVKPGPMLEGKVVAITGAAGGIGSAMAHILAAEGASVVVNDLPGRAGPVVEAIRALGYSALVAEGDVTSESDIEGIIGSAVGEFGRLDAMINNAVRGFPDDADVANMDLATWDGVQAVGLRAAMVGCKYAVRQFLQQKSAGSILNVSSTAAYQGDYRLSAYAAAKSGMLALTRSVATQYGRLGIRCNTVVPGCVVTANQAAAMGGGSALSDTRLTPRLGVPEDVAHLAAFLVSDRAEYITGQDWRVDGGGSAHQPWVPHLGDPPA